MLQVHIVTESRPSAVHRLRRLLGIGAVAGPDRNADAEFTDALFEFLALVLGIEQLRDLTPGLGFVFFNSNRLRLIDKACQNVNRELTR